MRVLETRKIPYQVISFSPDVHSAEGVALAAGVSANLVYKTLVVMRPSGKPMLIMVAGDRELDLKLTARSVGEKKVRMASQREAEALTGLKVGGISALALLNRGFDVFLDSAARDLDKIFVSAGQRGLNLKLKVAHLQKVTGARFIAAVAPG